MKPSPDMHYVTLLEKIMPRFNGAEKGALCLIYSLARNEARAGKSVFDNPYPIGTDKHQWWEMGYMDEDRKMREEALGI